MKHHLQWKAYFKLNASKPNTGQKRLFNPPHKDFELPGFEYNELIEAFDQMELLGFPLISQFSFLKHPLDQSILTRSLKKYVGKKILIYGDLITVKKAGTSNGKYMYFGTFYDREGEVFDTVQFPREAEGYPLRGEGIYRCRGIVNNEYGYISIAIKEIQREAMVSDPRLVNAF